MALASNVSFSDEFISKLNSLQRDDILTKLLDSSQYDLESSEDSSQAGSRRSTPSPQRNQTVTPLNNELVDSVWRQLFDSQ